jgi:hypothetical protein
MKNSMAAIIAAKSTFRSRTFSTPTGYFNSCGATEPRRRDRGTSQVKYNKGDEQFDIGPGIGNLRHALSRLRALKVDHPRADQRCQASG